MVDTNSTPPDAFFLEALARLDLSQGARVLDLACGRGRHALELARRGYEVEAWDRNLEALAILRAQAAAEGLKISIREVDCEAFPPSGPFELVVVFNYLDRSLPPKLIPSVIENAYLVYSTFTVDRSGAHPSDRWCLGQGELARGFDGWRVLHSVEAEGRAGIVAQRSQN